MTSTWFARWVEASVGFYRVAKERHYDVFVFAVERHLGVGLVVSRSSALTTLPFLGFLVLIQRWHVRLSQSFRGAVFRNITHSNRAVAAAASICSAFAGSDHDSRCCGLGPCTLIASR